MPALTRRRSTARSRDDLRVVAGIGGGGDGLDQLVQVGGSADPGDFAALGQLVRDGDGVRRFAPAVEVDDGFVDALVGGPVEVLRRGALRRRRRWRPWTASCRPAPTVRPRGPAAACGRIRSPDLLPNPRALTTPLPAFIVPRTGTESPLVQSYQAVRTFTRTAGRAHRTTALARTFSVGYSATVAPFPASTKRLIHHPCG